MPTLPSQTDRTYFFIFIFYLYSAFPFGYKALLSLVIGYNHAQCAGSSAPWGVFLEMHGISSQCNFQTIHLQPVTHLSVTKNFPPRQPSTWTNAVCISPVF